MRAEVALVRATVGRGSGGTSPAVRIGAMSESRFVGRDRELEELVRALDAAKADRGSLFLLSGEAGIGKTRLAEEIETRARASGALVLWGRCWEAGGAPVYWPWVQVLRSYLRQAGAETLAARQQRAAVLAQILPEIAEQLAELPAPPALDPDSARFALFDAVDAFLADAAAQTPLLIILDDLHAAERPSLLLLQFLVRKLREQPILAVGTYRDIEAERELEVAALLAEIAREGRRLVLGGLAEHDVAALIESSVGTTPSRAVAAAVHDTTEGNPFFVDEVAHLLAEEGTVTAERAPGPLAIPRGVRDAIARRLERISPEAKDVITVASVIGRTFDIEVLERVTDRSREQVLEAVQHATRERVVGEVLRTLGRYTFTHTLIRETLYDAIPAGRRAALHGRVAEALAEIHRGEIDIHWAELAHHAYEAARADGDPDRAIDFALAAGGQAFASLAYEDAVAHHRRALQLFSRTPRADEQRCDVLLMLGAALNASGEGEEAKETFGRAAGLARRTGDAVRLALAALGWGGDVGIVAAVDVALSTLLEDALDALPDEDSALRARLLARLALEQLFAGNAERVSTLSRGAVEIARRVGDAATLAYVLHVRSYSLLGPDDAEERRALAPEIVRLAQAVGDIQLAVQGHGWQIQTHLELGDRAGVVEEIEAVVRLAEDLRQPAYHYWATVFRATLAVMDGALEEAERLAQEALSVGRGPYQANAPVVYGAQLFAIRREQGRLDELADLLEAFVASQPALPVWRAVLAPIYLEAGRERAARSELDRLARDGFGAIPRDVNLLTALAFCAELTAALGDADRAAVLYEKLRPYAGRNLAVVQGIYYGGAIDHYRGILAATCRRRDEAIAHLVAAHATHEAMGARAWLARTRYELGRVLLETDRERALESLGLAAVAAQEIGMHRLESQLAAVLEAAQVPAGARSEAGEAVFRREENFWTISYAGVVMRLHDMRGLRYLAHLLRHPGREFHVRELLAGAGDPAASARAIAPDSDAGALLDARAKAAYRRRLEDLREDLDEAERWGDESRAGRAREEMEAIAGQLASAIGLGGRDRRAGAEAERARSAVGKRIRAAIERIETENEALGRHLRASVRTGYFCSYAPDPQPCPSWRL